MIVHPETYKRIMEISPTSEQQEAFKKAIQDKRKEYYAQKRTHLDSIKNEREFGVVARIERGSCGSESSGKIFLQ